MSTAAYWRGWADNTTGVPYNGNPYLKEYQVGNKKNWSDWQAGWRDADDESEQLNKGFEEF